MANINRYDPFNDVLDDLFKGYFVRPVGSAALAQAEQVGRARIDVTEQNDTYKVHAELPGVKKEDIKVQIEGDQVSISAETRVERDAKEGERLLHSERYYGKLARAFRLEQEVDESKASAKYTDGVLELVLPKKAAANARRLTIQ